MTESINNRISELANLLPQIDKNALIPNKSDHLKASSVLLILHLVEGVWHLLLTQRAAHLKHHAGQISFPGGRYEVSDEHLIDTAVRETEEEVGIPRDFLKVISQLDEHPTLTGYRIFPFVAITHSLPELTREENEVDDIFSAPLQFLIDKKNQQFEVVNFNGTDYDVYKIIWKERLIWGATARMIVNLSEFIGVEDLNGIEDSQSENENENEM